LKVLTVVGRSDDREAFENTLNSHLSSGFTIHAVVPLQQDGEASRFLAYVFADREEDEDNEGVADGIAEYLTDMLYLVHVHDDPQTAGEWASEQHGEDADTRFMDPITAREIYKRDVLVGLVHTGELTMIRAVYEGRSIVVLAHLTAGHGPNDVLATPFALMVDREMVEKIELPIKMNKEDV
jgi:hypothetical protein